MKNNKSLFIMSIVSIVFAVAAVALLVISLLNNNDKFDTVGNDINNVNVSNKDLYAKLDEKNDDILKAEKDNKTAVMKLARSLSNDETEAISELVSTESGVITTNINELKELILKENEAIKANVLENNAVNVLSTKVGTATDTNDTLFGKVNAVSSKLDTMDGKLDSILENVTLNNERSLYAEDSTFVLDINGWMKANDWTYNNVDDTEELLHVITSYLVNSDVIKY